MIRILQFIFGSFFIFVGAISLFIFTGTIPDSKAVTGHELSASAKEKLVESGIVANNEPIEYFYSEGLTSFVDYGNLFTDTRVISYELDPDTDERTIYQATYNEISNIEFEKSNDVLADSLIYVYEKGVYSFTLIVSNEERGDEAFYNKLASIWKAKNKSASLVEANWDGE